MFFKYFFSFQVVLELDLTGTYFGHKWLLSRDNYGIYLHKNESEFKKDSNNTNWKLDQEKKIYFYSGEFEKFAYFNFDNQTVIPFKYLQS